ncbi:MAG: RsmE family RNA methyltransferase [Ferruginibacter sp.]
MWRFMSAPFFYSDNFLAAQPNLLSEETSRHIIQVLRMKKGEQVLITNGKGYLFTTEIIEADKKQTAVTILDTSYQPQIQKNITIAVSPLKNTGRYEWFLEKATEIGVSQIIPLISRRTEKLHNKRERMMNIIVSAMVQSRQTWLPFLGEPILFFDFIHADLAGHKYIAHCDTDHTKQHLSSFIPITDASVLIGPEGDFTADEIAIALKAGYTPVSLGNNRLRTETAGMVAVSIMNI